MNCTISSLYYSPIKSLSFQKAKFFLIKKNLGIIDDRIFAFSRNLKLDKAKSIAKNPHQRHLINFLTLKNTPSLNKFNFVYENGLISLFLKNRKIISIDASKQKEALKLSNKFLEIEKTITGPIYLLKNIKYPFFDTTYSNRVSNTISLINLNSIKDFERKINRKIEFERFRGNIYINGINAFDERSWIDKIIKINQIKFKVLNHIPRCSATNLKVNSVEQDINLPLKLKKTYGHIDMGIYLSPLNSGKISLNDKITLG
ncbi:MAG: MOSC domain-containing protein [Alphaproteobacteria bacterium]|nr:MOSC domain-containing protein [Alphaproteobacteria bacterium]